MIKHHSGLFSECAECQKELAIETHECTPQTGGIKYDQGKLPFHLLPYDALVEVVKVLQQGASKYGERNWEKGMAHSRVGSAALRHLTADVMGGQRVDSESGLVHLAHATVNNLFLLAYRIRGIGEDDLPGSSTYASKTEDGA